MQFILFVCVDPAVKADVTVDDINRWVDTVGRGRREGGPLRPPATAATVRVRNDERQVTDGPFAQTREYVSGFDLIECDTREQAIDIAAAHPVARFGSIEVRQIHVD